MRENEYGTWPSYTCPVCGTQDAEETVDGETFCTVCDAVDGEAQ